MMLWISVRLIEPDCDALVFYSAGGTGLWCFDFPFSRENRAVILGFLFSRENRIVVL